MLLFVIRRVREYDLLRMITFHLSDRLPPSAVFETKEWFELKAFKDILIAPDQPAPGLPLDLGALTQLAGLIISVISLCLNVHRDLAISSEKGRWTAERLQKILQDELLSLGVQEYDILAIKDFERLRAKSHLPCTILARDHVSGRGITLLVFYDGSSSFTISSP
jgi:hypothetical protein